MPLIFPLLVRQDVRLLNAIRPPVAPATSGNVYEFRNYRARTGGAVRQWIEHFTGVLPEREKYSKIVGLWQTEASQPNEVCHIWAYPSLNARAEVRGAALKDPAWQAFLAKGMPLLDEMTLDHHAACAALAVEVRCKVRAFRKLRHGRDQARP